MARAVTAAHLHLAACARSHIITLHDEIEQVPNVFVIVCHNFHTASAAFLERAVLELHCRLWPALVSDTCAGARRCTSVGMPALQ
jgi:hypothetical protein